MKRTRLTYVRDKQGNRSRAFKISFEKVGGWKKADILMDNLNPALIASQMWGERKVAEMLLRIVKGHLKNQDLGWQALSRDTLFKKRGDGRVLVWTESYLNSIKTWQQKGVRFVGVNKDATHPETGNPIWQIAQIHEYKSYNGGPYRALWGPSYEEIGGNAGVRAIITRVIYNKMRKLGYPINY